MRRNECVHVRVCDTMSTTMPNDGDDAFMPNPPPSDVQCNRLCAYQCSMLSIGCADIVLYRAKLPPKSNIYNEPHYVRACVRACVLPVLYTSENQLSAHTRRGDCDRNQALNCTREKERWHQQFYTHTHTRTRLALEH